MEEDAWQLAADAMSCQRTEPKRRALLHLCRAGLGHVELRDDAEVRDAARGLTRKPADCVPSVLRKICYLRVVRARVICPLIEDLNKALPG